MRRKIAAFALAGLLALAGCSAGGVKLDREVEIGGLTMRVPSGWVEDGDDSEFGYGSRTYESSDEDSYDRIYVRYSELEDDDPSPDEDMEDNKEFIESELDSGDYSYSKVDETVIDGAECTTYEVESAVTKALGEDSQTIIYIDSMDTRYVIDVIGDVDLGSLMDSLSL